MIEKYTNKILAFILTFFILFTNVSSSYGYDWDLQVPSISDDIIINGSDNIIIDEPTNSKEDTIITNNTPNINVSNNHQLIKQNKNNIL